MELIYPKTSVLATGIVLGIIYVHFDKGELFMIIAFQVILLLIVFVSFGGIIGEKKDMRLRDILVIICVVSILSYLATVVLL